LKRTHPLLAVVGILFHGGMMFLLPLMVGFVASLFMEVSEVAETALGLALGALVVVGPAFLAMVAGVFFKVVQEARFFWDKGRLDPLMLLEVVHRHMSVVTLTGYAVLVTGIVFVLLALQFQWASLGVLAVLSLLLFYWVVGASVFLSAFMVRTFAWGMGRRRSGIRRELSPAVVQTGELVEERFHLTRVPIFPGFRLLIHDRLPGRLDTESRYIATPAATRETVTVSGLLRRTPRGRYRTGAARIQYEDALGLTRVAVASMATAELTVLPRVRTVRVVEPPRSLDENPDILTIRHREANEDYYNFRAYVPGDDTRHIHWKLSMRAGRLQVRLPESREISRRKVVLALDTRLQRANLRVKPALSEILDALVQAWVSLADEMVRDGEHVTLVSSVAGDEGPEVEQMACRRGGGSPWLELGARVTWQSRHDLADLFEGVDEETADLVVLSSRFDAPPPQALPGKRVTWIYLAPEDVLGEKPPSALHRWVGEGNANALGILKRLLVLPYSAGSTLNSPIWRSYEFLRTLDRDSRLVLARRLAVRSSRRVLAALMGRPDSVYRMEVGPRHYVLRGLKGLKGQGRGNP
jgi:uncharacterized protein (DUF58 family)